MSEAVRTWMPPRPVLIPPLSPRLRRPVFFHRRLQPFTHKVLPGLLLQGHKGCATAAGMTSPPVPKGMDAVHVGVDLVPTALAELRRRNTQRVFVMANRSSAPLAEPLVAALREQGTLAAPLCLDIGMGGGEEGLLRACDAAAAAGTDAVVTIGGGAIHDAGKLVRLWLSVCDEDGATASVEGIQRAAQPVELELAPQLCAPNSFAMAELTSVAGVTTRNNVKSGAAHPAMMPTVVIYDPMLSRGLPDWVRFGTALRGVEHAIGAVCHPQATDEHRASALRGLKMVVDGLRAMVDNPESEDANVDVYRGGWITIRALNEAGYPAIAHFVQNHYSARYGVHQGSCSGVLSARILHQHRSASAKWQELVRKHSHSSPIRAESLRHSATQPLICVVLACAALRGLRRTWRASVSVGAKPGSEPPWRGQGSR